jgi:hypothetical protein
MRPARFQCFVFLQREYRRNTMSIFKKLMVFAASQEFQMFLNFSTEERYWTQCTDSLIFIFNSSCFIKRRC